MIQCFCNFVFSFQYTVVERLFFIHRRMRMKITKSFKKGFIAFALSLATVFTGAGFGLLGNVVTADEGDAPVTKPITSVGDMFIGENLTVTENGKSYKYDADAETPDTKPDYSGVLLSAQDKDETTGKGSVYKAEINAVFMHLNVFARCERQRSRGVRQRMRWRPK